MSTYLTAKYFSDYELREIEFTAAMEAEAEPPDAVAAAIDDSIKRALDAIAAGATAAAASTVAPMAQSAPIDAIAAEWQASAALKQLWPNLAGYREAMNAAEAAAIARRAGK